MSCCSEVSASGSAAGVVSDTARIATTSDDTSWRITTLLTHALPLPYGSSPLRTRFSAGQGPRRQLRRIRRLAVFATDCLTWQSGSIRDMSRTAAELSMNLPDSFAHECESTECVPPRV